MRRSSKRGIILLSICAVALSFVPLHAQIAELIAGAGNHNSAQVFKNIQVLKDMPPEQMITAMMTFSAALGVGCPYCHDKTNDLDTKPPKHIARQMIQLTSEINSKFFGEAQKITCYTCHQGGLKPVEMAVYGNIVMAPKDELEKPVVSSDSAPLPDSLEILRKYITAIGGDDAIHRITSRVEKGTVIERHPTGLPKQLIVESYSEIPGKFSIRRYSVTNPADVSGYLGAYLGDDGWFQEHGGEFRQSWKSRIDATKLDDSLNFLLHIDQIVMDLRTTGIEIVGDHEAYVLTGHTKMLPLVKLYFDRNSGLLLRMYHQTETVVGAFPVQIDYSDYRNVDGISTPFRWTYIYDTVDYVGTFPGRTWLTYQLDEVIQNAAIDPDKFRKPSVRVVLAK